MARLLYPDEGNRFVYRLNGNSLESATSASAIIYLDEACTTLANIASYSGANPGPVIATSMVVTDSFSRLPLFWGPDNVDTLYAVISGGPVTPIYARFDGRIDDIDAKLSTLGVSGYLNQPYASPLVPQNASASFISVGELIADMTIAAPTSHGGNALTLQFAQGAVPHQVVWNSEFNTTWQPTPTPYTVSTITFRWSGTKWEVISTGSPEGSGTPRSIQFALANFSATATLTALARAVFSGAGIFSASATLSAAAASLSEFRIWPTVSGPSVTTNDGAAVNLATEFYVTSAASLKRFWIWSTGNYPAEGAILTRLWTVASDGLSGTAVPGTDLAFGTSLPSGWVSLDLPAPVALTPNQHYRAVGSFPGTYVGTTGYFSGTGAGAAGFSSGALVVPNAAGASGGMQGSYANGAGRQFPGLTWNGSNYWIDVSVSAGALGPPVFSAAASLSAQQVSAPGTLVEPTAVNTGPRQTPLSTVAATTITVDGTTWNRVQVNGELRIEANNVTLNDCKIVGNVALSKGQGIGNYPPKSNITLNYCELASADSLGVDRFTMDHCRIIGVPTGTVVMLQSYANGSAEALVTNTVLTSNYWAHPPPFPAGGDPNGAHRELIFLFGGVHDTLMRGNSFNFVAESQPSATLISADVFSQGRTVGSVNQNVNNWTFDNNWLYGGGFFQIYFDERGGSSATNNKFHSYERYPGGGTVNRPVITPAEGGYASTYVPMSPVTGNTLDGAPYTIPNPT